MSDTVAPRPANRQLFRESVLRKHASPENLDRLLTVTTPYGWFALAGFLLIIVLVIAWSIVGRLPVVVRGSGILLTSGEVWTVTAPGSGRISELLVGFGDHVDKGELVARIDQPELKLAVDQARHHLDEILAAEAAMIAFEAGLAEQHRRNWSERESAIKEQIARLEVDVAAYGKLADSSEALLTKGYATTRDALASRSTSSDNLRALAAAKLQLLALDAERSTYDQEVHNRRFDMTLRVNDARYQFDAKNAEFENASRVFSQYSGVVIEASTEFGRDTKAGDVLLRLEPTDHKLIALLYLPPGPGKRVQADMAVRLATESFNKEEYGYILGKVFRISKIPQSEEKMKMELESSALVQQMMKNGPPLRALAELEEDPRTPSGLRWSSSEGPPEAITQGTFVQAEVVIEYRRPIELAIPLLKSLLGI